MNIIVPIIISSHLPQSSQPSPCLTRLLTITTTLKREKTTRYGGFIYIYIRAQGEFNRSIIWGYIVQSIMLFFWQIPVILFVSRGPPFVLVTSEPFYPVVAPLRPKWYKLGRSGTPAPLTHKLGTNLGKWFRKIVNERRERSTKQRQFSQEFERSPW